VVVEFIDKILFDKIEPDDTKSSKLNNAENLELIPEVIEQHDIGISTKILEKQFCLTR